MFICLFVASSLIVFHAYSGFLKASDQTGFVPRRKKALHLIVGISLSCCVNFVIEVGNNFSCGG